MFLPWLGFKPVRPILIADSTVIAVKKRFKEITAIPTKLLEVCHEHILQIYEFLPHCNTNITSDAKVGIHQLAGAARAAYQVRVGKSCSGVGVWYIVCFLPLLSEYQYLKSPLIYALFFVAIIYIYMYINIRLFLLILHQKRKRCV